MARRDRNLADGEGCGVSPGTVALAAFAHVLRHQSGAVGYLITYQSEQSGPCAWRRIGQYDIERLKDYGVSPDRLKILHGGTDDRPSDQFWVQPKDEAPPIKEAAPDRLADKAVMIHEYDEYQLQDSKDQEYALKGVVDLLKEYPDVKVCYMIMPPFPDEDEPADRTQEKPKEYELPMVDYKQIVESWKTKLITELKIDPNRIVVLFPTGVDEIFDGRMQSWIVPANAELPSPPKMEDDPPDDRPSVYSR